MFALVGSLFGGVLAGYGRRYGMIFLDIVGFLICALAIPALLMKNIWIFYIFRMISGIVTGFNCTVSPLYIKEMSPKAVSGLTGTFF